MTSSARHFFALLITKIGLNLRSEAGKHQLSYIWWLLEPLLEAAVFYVVFGIFLAGGTPNFVAFLLTGLIPWTWFSRSVSNAMTSLKGAQWLLSNFKIHPAFFPLVELGQDAVKQLVTFGFLLGFLVFYGIAPTHSWLWLPLVMGLQLALVTGAASLAASLLPLLEDLKFLIATILQALMFASGIFYDARVLVTQEWTAFYFANPIASLLQMYRDVLLYGLPPNLTNVYVVLIWSVGLGLLAWLSLRHYRGRYARLILE